MANVINPNAIPTADSVRTEVEFDEVVIPNVIDGDSERDITVQVIPFNRRDDSHVEFAYAFSDMLYRAPSRFRDISEAARSYVTLFMRHTKEESNSAGSDFNLIMNDLRACRILFNHPKIQKDLNDFFGGV